MPNRKTVAVAVTAKPPIHRLLVQRCVSGNLFEPVDMNSDVDFRTSFSNRAGTEPMAQQESDLEVFRSKVTSSRQVAQDSICEDTDCARATESSPSRWAMISSGATGWEV